MFFEWTFRKSSDHRRHFVVYNFGSQCMANAKKTIHLEANFFKVILLGNYRS
jgi:hypothetical protein